MKQKFLVFSLITTIVVGVASSATHADTTLLVPHSWDAGMFATSSNYDDSAHSWGKRTTQGAWGTSSVNYQSGSTNNYRASSSGSLNVVLNGSYCPGGVCSYGSGSGFKGLVQFWNDPGNFIAFGLIHDPGVSPSGTTLMIEGSANGRPIGGYWPAGAITGTSHLFTVNWGPAGISVNIDHNVNLGPYPVSVTNPSVSFLSAGRNTGDISDTTFSGINFSPGSVVADPIVVPAGNPYLTFSADVTQSGSGTGHSAYLNAHDASNNAISVGIQSDTGSPESQGNPYYVWERVQNGTFTYQYLGAATNGTHPLTLKWWKGEQTALFYDGSTPIANISVNLLPRLFFGIEGNGRLNGDTVNDTFTNAQVTVGDSCPTYCGLNGTWNTTDFNFHGLTATRTNSQMQNGANFTVNGTVSGLQPGHDWDSDLVAGIGMIAQYWNGQ